MRSGQVDLTLSYWRLQTLLGQFFFTSLMYFRNSCLLSRTLLQIIILELLKHGRPAYRDMSSVMWMLLPFNMAAFLRTCSLSLKSSKVTTMGRHPPTSGPVCILAAFVMTMSLLRERVCFSREFI